MPYSLCTNIEWFQVFLLVLILIAAALGLITIIYGIRQSLLNIHKHWINLKAFLITYYITCLLWMIGIIGYIISAILPYTNRCNDIILINNVGTLMGFNVYYGGLIGVYLLFLLRLKYLFVDHALLKLSNCKFYSLLSGAIIQTILFIAACYHFMTFNWTTGAILLYGFTVSNVIYLLILLLTFLRYIIKLQRLTKQQSKQQSQSHTNTGIEYNESKQDTENIDDYNSKSNQTQTITVTSFEISSTLVSGASITKQSIDSVHMEHPNNNLAEYVVKYTLCVFFAFLSTMIANGMAFYRGFINDTFQLLTIHETFVMWDFFVNILFLHLQFVYAQKYYLRLCGCLRNKLKSYALVKFDEA
eukprot:428837_1